MHWKAGRLQSRTLGHIKKIRTIYGLDLTARDSHRLVEEDHVGE